MVGMFSCLNPLYNKPFDWGMVMMVAGESIGVTSPGMAACLCLICCSPTPDLLGLVDGR